MYCHQQFCLSLLEGFFYVVLWLSDEYIADKYFDHATMRKEKYAYRNLCPSVGFIRRSTKLFRSTMFASS